MGRSITFRLMLSFLLVGITVVALASGATYWLTAREFRQLTYDQARDRFLSDVTFYYEANGSWDGVLGYYQERAAPRFSFNAGPGGVSGPGEGQRPPLRIFFALADQNGRVVIPAGSFALGSMVPSERLAQGTPVTVNTRRVGTVLLAGELPPMGLLEQRYLSRTNLGLLYAAVGASILALILGALLARALTQPVRALTGAIRAMAGGDLKQRVDVTSKDEIGELAAAFNQMSTELDRLLQARRQMTSDIAHDLRNPLTVIGGYVESMREGVLKPTPERLDAMQAEVQHLKRLVEDLRLLSQADAGELILNRERVPVRWLLERAAQSYRPLADKQLVALTVDAPEGLPDLHADPDRLMRVLGNLLGNSLRYTARGGTIHLSAEAPDREHVTVSVQDTGSGIAPEDLPHIFDRMYRGDSARTDTDESGLGLAIARSIVEAHGGTIGAESAPGAGTLITMTLPAHKPDDEEA